MVCGAVSRPPDTVASYGIQVIPFVAGDLREVIGAWLSGNLESDTFVMPGCSGAAEVDGECGVPEGMNLA